MKEEEQACDAMKKTVAMAAKIGGKLGRFLAGQDEKIALVVMDRIPSKD